MKYFKIKTVSAMEKVFASKEPSGEGCMLHMTALKGETISFQLAYYWAGERKERGKVEISSPIKEYANIRLVQLVPCEYPCHLKRDDDYLVTEPGLYPDLLTEIPALGFPMVSGQWRSLWVDVEIPEESEAGVYPLEIRMIHDGELVGKVEMTIEIIAAVLPKLSLLHTEWFHSDCLAQYYGVPIFSEQYWNIVEQFVLEATKRHCNMILTPIFTPPLDTAVGGERPTVQLVDVWEEEKGQYRFEFERLERWVSLCKRCGIEYFEMSHLFSQWGAVAAPKVVGYRDGELQKLFGWDTDASGEEYAAFLHQFLTALKKELEQLGIAEKTYFHISDEPQMSQLESYQAARNVVAEDLKDYVIFDALSDYEFYQKGLVSQPVCALNHIEPFLKDRPEKLWGYYCTAQYQDVSNRFIAQPGQRTRILGAQLYKYNIDGFLHWGYNFYNSEYSLYEIDPYKCTDAGGAFPSGDSFLVYPGPGGKPEESIRMMMMDEAMNDFRAMKLLEQLAGREAVMKCIESSPEEIVTFSKYPRSISYMIACRNRINEAIRQAL